MDTPQDAHAAAVAVEDTMSDRMHVSDLQFNPYDISDALRAAGNRIGNLSYHLYVWQQGERWVVTHIPPTQRHTSGKCFIVHRGGIARFLPDRGR